MKEIRVRGTDPSKRFAVIGAGWAGCAAAAELAAAGRRVILLEATQDLGGRGRRVDLDLGNVRHRLDNGQHLLLGAFRETADLMARVGIDRDHVIERRPFEVVYPGGVRLRAARLREPWHLVVALLGARGLSLTDRIAMATFLPRARRQCWRVDPDRDAGLWLQQMGQTPNLIARLWRPLALAALNTPIERASAQIFANVLRDSLGARNDASDLWLPRVDLSALLPEAVERFVLARGGEVRRGARVDLLRCQPETGDWSVTVRTRGEHESIDVGGVVYAAAPLMLPRVLGLHLEALRAAVRMIERFRFEPIATVYLKFDAAVRLPRPMHALEEDVSDRRYGQWVFDRGALDQANAGVLAVVISASGSHEEEPLDRLGDAVARQLRDAFNLPKPSAIRAIVERRATLSALPDLSRPPNATSLPALVLAGDWTESDYPSTLETAVRSGRAAARELIAEKPAEFVSVAQHL